MSLPIDDHFLSRYRALIDQEDAAFDELEHAFEDGDRQHFQAEVTVWQDALSKKLSFLSDAGIEVALPALL